MKAAITAGLSAMLLAGVVSPAFADTTVIQTTAQPTVVSAPAILANPTVGAPACSTTVRELTFPATYPGGVVQVVPTPCRAYAFDYGYPTMDYSMDYTWEPFYIYGDIPTGGGAGGGGG
ncbi:MAG TPA: hypothetical protein V6D22_12305 [Candidatus Obscuribacterales bacterium]